MQIQLNFYKPFWGSMFFPTPRGWFPQPMGEKRVFPVLDIKKEITDKTATNQQEIKNVSTKIEFERIREFQPSPVKNCVIIMSI